MKLSEYIEELQKFPQDLEVAGIKYDDYSQTPDLSVKKFSVNQQNEIDYIEDETEEKDFLLIDWQI